MKKFENLSEETAKKVLAYMIIAALTFVFVYYPQMSVFADDGGALVTSSFSTLTSVVTALISSIGELLLLWGFFEWGTALQSQEGVMQASAFKRIGGGLIMVLAPTLITAFIK